MQIHIIIRARATMIYIKCYWFKLHQSKIKCKMNELYGIYLIYILSNLYIYLFFFMKKNKKNILVNN